MANGGLTFRMQGVDALVKALKDSLPAAMSNLAYGPAMKAGSVLVLTAAKANAQAAKDTGLLASSLISKVKVYKRKKGDAAGQVVAAQFKVGSDNNVTGVRRYKTSSKVTLLRPSKYAHLVEHGTKHSAAKPFMRPAMEQNKGAALAAITERLASGLTKAAKSAKGGASSPVKPFELISSPTSAVSQSASFISERRKNNSGGNASAAAWQDRRNAKFEERIQAKLASKNKARQERKEAARIKREERAYDKRIKKQEDAE